MPLIELRMEGEADHHHLGLLKQVVERAQGPQSWRVQPWGLAPASPWVDRLAHGVMALERSWVRSKVAPTRVVHPPGGDPMPIARANVGRAEEGGVAGHGPPDVLVVFQPAGAPMPDPGAARHGLVLVTWPQVASTATVGLREVLARSHTASWVITVRGPDGARRHQVDVAVPTQMVFSWTHDVVLSKAAAMAGQCVARVLSGGSWPTPPAVEDQLTAMAAGTTLGALDVLGYGGRMAVRVAAKLGRAVTDRGGTWHISLSRGGWREHLAGPRQRLPNPPHRFWADPFVWHREGRDYLFVEDFDRRLGQAHLSVLEIDGQGQVHELGACLREPFHLSYPFLFEWQGQLCMCPETSAARQIRVYRCDDFPLRWSLAAVLMDQVSAADSMLLNRDGRWWLLTNLDASGGIEHCTELHVFWADSPLSTQWTPHPGNPVITDATRARNGGLVQQVDGVIHRVSQIQRHGVYGAGFRVNALETLSPSAFAEHELARHEPVPHDEGDEMGAHHLSSNGRWTVSDHLR